MPLERLLRPISCAARSEDQSKRRIIDQCLLRNSQRGFYYQFYNMLLRCSRQHAVIIAQAERREKTGSRTRRRGRRTGKMCNVLERERPNLRRRSLTGRRKGLEPRYQALQ